MRAGSGIPPARAPTAHKGEGYGSNRSREGPHPSSSGKWQAERGRRGAGASRLARPKGPPAHRDDDGREQKGNFARSRSRPHVLIAAEPSAIDRGIPLRTATAQRAPLPKEKPRRRRGSRRRRSRLTGLRLAPVRAVAEKKNPANGGAQVLGRTNSEGRRARSASTNAQPRVGFRAFHKKFLGDRMRPRLYCRRSLDRHSALKTRVNALKTQALHL